MNRLARVFGSLVLLLGWSAFPVFGDEPAFQPLGLELVAERPAEPDSSLASQLAWFETDSILGPVTQRVVLKLPLLMSHISQFPTRPCSLDVLLQLPLESRWETGMNDLLVNKQAAVYARLDSLAPTTLGIAIAPQELNPDSLRTRLERCLVGINDPDAQDFKKEADRRVKAYAPLRYQQARPHARLIGLDDQDVYELHCLIEQELPRRMHVRWEAEKKAAKQAQRKLDPSLLRVTTPAELRLTRLRRDLTKLRTAVILANTQEQLARSGGVHMVILIDYLDGRGLLDLASTRHFRVNVYEFTNFF